MTKQFQVLLALKALATATFPTADIRGFDQDTSKPSKVGQHGCIIGHPSDPGEPEVDLSPPAYNYQHRFYFEVVGPNGAGGELLDNMLANLGAAIVADRYLGGLCSWLEAGAPDRNDRTTDTVATTNWAVVPINAEYSTDNPLG